MQLPLVRLCKIWRAEAGQQEETEERQGPWRTHSCTHSLTHRVRMAYPYILLQPPWVGSAIFRMQGAESCGCTTVCIQFLLFTVYTVHYWSVSSYSMYIMHIVNYHSVSSYSLCTVYTVHYQYVTSYLLYIVYTVHCQTVHYRSVS